MRLLVRRPRRQRRRLLRPNVLAHGPEVGDLCDEFVFVENTGCVTVLEETMLFFFLFLQPIEMLYWGGAEGGEAT